MVDINKISYLLDNELYINSPWAPSPDNTSLRLDSLVYWHGHNILNSIGQVESDDEYEEKEYELTTFKGNLNEFINKYSELHMWTFISKLTYGGARIQVIKLSNTNKSSEEIINCPDGFTLENIASYATQYIIKHFSDNAYLKSKGHWRISCSFNSHTPLIEAFIGCDT